VKMALAHRGLLSGSRMGVDAADTAIKTDSAARWIADYPSISIVDVSDARMAQIIDLAVIIKSMVAPIPAVVSAPEISEAVVDATIEPDLRPPISGVENVKPTDPSPPGWGPKHADHRR